MTTHGDGRFVNEAFLVQMLVQVRDRLLLIGHMTCPMLNGSDIRGLDERQSSLSTPSDSYVV